tara:strand:+ start:11 stop:619 length:609 start_codon:yes stop_codon:yes gene_type:complete
MTIKLGFSHEINTSVQVGDLVYFTNTSPSGGYDVSDLSNINLIGPVQSINRRQGLSTSFLKIFNATASQTNFNLGGSPWSQSANTPFDIAEFEVKVNNIIATPIVEYTYPSGTALQDIEFLNPLNINDVVEVTLFRTIDVDETLMPVTASVLTNNSFILFKKNEEINTAGIKGYYAEVKFLNNSDTKAGLFAVGAEINESSK